MDGLSASFDKVARRASIMAVALGCLSLAATFFDPLVGAFNALIFFAAAYGIRRGQAWPAIATTCILVVPLARAVLGGSGQPVTGVLAVAGLAFSGLVTIALAWWPARAAVTFWKSPQGSRASWPWIAVLCVLAAGWLFFKPYVMPTSSMENSILMGDSILVETVTWRLGREPKRGQVVVFRYPVDPKQTFLKRVAGVPGDRLRIVNKRLYLNGSPVSEPYAIHKTGYIDSYRDNFPSTPTVNIASQGTDMLQNHVRAGEVVVPPGQYFVLGDDRDDSLDSRYWGFAPRSDIIGSPFVVYASFDVGTGREGISMPSIRNTRWSRLLKVL